MSVHYLSEELQLLSGCLEEVQTDLMILLRVFQDKGEELQQIISRLDVVCDLLLAMNGKDGGNMEEGGAECDMKEQDAECNMGEGDADMEVYIKSEVHELKRTTFVSVCQENNNGDEIMKVVAAIKKEYFSSDDKHLKNISTSSPTSIECDREQPPLFLRENQTISKPHLMRNLCDVMSVKPKVVTMRSRKPTPSSNEENAISDMAVQQYKDLAFNNIGIEEALLDSLEYCCNKKVLRDNGSGSSGEMIIDIGDGESGEEETELVKETPRKLKELIHVVVPVTEEQWSFLKTDKFGWLDKVLGYNGSFAMNENRGECKNRTVMLSGPPAQVVLARQELEKITRFSMTVSKKIAGGIIGCKGELIDLFSRSAGVRIDVDIREEDSDERRDVKILGTAANVDKAKQFISSVVARHWIVPITENHRIYLTRAGCAQLHKLQHETGTTVNMVGGSGQEDMWLDVSGSRDDCLEATKFMKTLSSIQVPITNSEAGALIGKGGNNLKSIWRETEAVVTIKENVKGDGRVVEVFGTLQNIASVKKILARMGIRKIACEGDNEENEGDNEENIKKSNDFGKNINMNVRTPSTQNPEPFENSNCFHVSKDHCSYFQEKYKRNEQVFMNVGASVKFSKFVGDKRIVHITGKPEAILKAKAILDNVSCVTLPVSDSKADDISTKKSNEEFVEGALLLVEGGKGNSEVKVVGTQEELDLAVDWIMKVASSNLEI